MAIDLALFQPDIAQNTGTLLRLGACLGFTVHIIHPAGFPITRQTLARAGLDYLDAARMIEHDSWSAFGQWRTAAGRRLVLLTTKASISAYEARFAGNDILLLGRESSGVPPDVAEQADLRIRIPMAMGMRSINVALAGAMVIGEAKRQTDGFTALA